MEGGGQTAVESLTMSRKITDKIAGAEDRFSTCRTQRGDRNKAGAKSGEGRAGAPRSRLRVGLREHRGQGSVDIGSGGVAESEEGAEAAGPRRGSKGTPKDLHVVKRSSGKWERKAERLDGGAEMKARDGDISCVSRMAFVERLNLVSPELKKMEEDPQSLMISCQLTQKKVKRVRGELTEKNVLIESLPEAAKVKKRGGGSQERRPGDVTKGRWYKVCLQECFPGFVRAVYDRVLDFARLETSGLCDDWASVAQS